MTISPEANPEIHIRFLSGQDRRFPTSHHGRRPLSERFRSIAVANNQTLTDSQNIPLGRGQETLEIPTVRPSEIAPTELTAILDYNEPQNLLEIHGSFGVDGMIAAHFSVTGLDEEYPRLVYSPGESVEREIYPDSHEYHIRMQQFRDLSQECHRRGYTSLGQTCTPEFVGTSLMYTTETLSPSRNGELSERILPKMTEVLQRGLSRGVSL